MISLGKQNIKKKRKQTQKEVSNDNNNNNKTMKKYILFSPCCPLSQCII